MRLRATAVVVVGFLGAVGMAGCNMTKFAADQTSDVLKVAAPSLNMESDVQFAREAAPGQLKTVEGFWLASPGNKKLIRILAQGYCEYSFGFLDNDYQELDMNGRGDEPEAQALKSRATAFYLRCMNYGTLLLGKGWKEAIQGEMEPFAKKVKKSRNKEGLFFTALGLASAININRDDIDLVAYLPMAKLMFERVIELDEKFYNGSAHMALGMLYTGQGAAIGGNPEEGKKHFEKALEITKGRFLMTRVLYALNYGTITNDREFFKKTLVEVLNTSPAIWPEQRLANELAHIRARRYLAHEKEWF